MKDNYLDIIARSSKKYQSSMSYLISILLFCSAIFYIIYTNDHSLESYKKISGKVVEIKMDKIKVKSKATFNFKKLVLNPVIAVKIDQSYYYVDKEYKEKWNNILNRVVSDDYVVMRYKLKEGYKFIVDIRKDGKEVLSIGYTKKMQSKVIVIFFIVITVLLYIIMVIVYKRKMWLRKSN